MKRIMVTGGAGYVGSTLVGVLLNEGNKVIVVDNLSFGGEAIISYLHHPNFIFIKADLTDFAAVKGILAENNIDAIVHLAAIVGDPACGAQPDLAEKVNWEASLNLLNEAMSKGVERFIFSSTCSNYGKMAASAGFVTENSQLAPVSLYAELKVKFEDMLLNKIEKKSNFCPTALRFATVYGISSRMRFDLTVNEFVKELALGRELQVFGEQFWRPYCHVYDFARAISLVLSSEHEKVAYEVFNVGDTRENYQKQGIVDEIKKVLPNANVKYIPKDEDPRDYRVSFEKIQQTLGFNISKTVPDGIVEIKDMIESGIIINPDDPKYSNILSVRKEHDTLIGA